MTSEPPDRHPPQRATDAERDHAFGIVQEAHADGRLDRVELEERLEKVSISKTRTELVDLTADLQQTAHGVDAGDRLVLRTTGGSLKRSGQWQVPPHILVESKHARIRLDFTAAVVRRPEVLVALDCAHTSVTLIVPRGWSVATFDLTSEWSRVKDQTDQSMTGGSQLRIVGFAKHSTLRVRHQRGR